MSETEHEIKEGSPNKVRNSVLTLLIVLLILVAVAMPFILGALFERGGL